MPRTGERPPLGEVVAWPLLRREAGEKCLVGLVGEVQRGEDGPLDKGGVGGKHSSGIVTRYSYCSNSREGC